MFHSSFINRDCKNFNNKYSVLSVWFLSGFHLFNESDNSRKGDLIFKKRNLITWKRLLNEMFDEVEAVFDKSVFKKVNRYF